MPWPPRNRPTCTTSTRNSTPKRTTTCDPDHPHPRSTDTTTTTIAAAGAALTGAERAVHGGAGTGTQPLGRTRPAVGGTPALAGGPAAAGPGVLHRRAQHCRRVAAPLPRHGRPTGHDCPTTAGGDCPRRGAVGEPRRGADRVAAPAAA